MRSQSPAAPRELTDRRAALRSEAACTRPTAGFEGSDEFTYTVRDPTGRESTATVFVTVEAPPAAGGPVAHDDDVSTRRGTKVDFRRAGQRRRAHRR